MRTSFRSFLLLLAIAVCGLANCNRVQANQAPTVSIVSPVDEYEDLSAPANLNIAANASDSDGSVAKVDFYQGSTLLGTVSQSPFTFAWNNVAVGRYILTAKATDNLGATTTSASVHITINGAPLDGLLDRKYYPNPSDTTTFMPYRLFIPAGYDPTKKYPVVLFLHGLGEAGTDNIKQLNNNGNGSLVFVSAANQAAHPCFMIAPQSASGWWSGTGAQIDILLKIQAKYSIDLDRNYITGLSAGGMGTWGSLIAHPTMFAAAVPCSGNADNSKASLLTSIPIWDFHCADDPTVSVAGSDQIISAIRAAGGNPIYTRYAVGGHSAWVPAYASPNTVSWVMAQRRGVAAINSPLLAISTPTNQPTLTTNASTVNLGGTTIDSSTLVTQVAWTNSQGGNGTGAGTANWTITGIPLKTGDNLIQVVATGTSYSASYGGVTTFNDTLKVTYSATENTPPTITKVADLTINENSNTGALAFTVGDAETAAAALTVSAASSNTTLVPGANIVLGGSGANRTVTVTPASNQSGNTTITLTVSDGSAATSSTFILTVNALNTPPTITKISDQSITANRNTGALTFTVGDLETPAASLIVSGTSSNTTLIPNTNIVFAGSGANRTVTVSPLQTQSGTATITLTVSDGTATASSTFLLTVKAVVAAIDCGGTANFTAADGTVYSADMDFSGGSVNNFVRPIANTTDDALYQHYRWNNPTLTYSIPVPNGPYAVTLKFADVYSSGPGQKVFDVKSEGVLVAHNLDTYALAGKDTAYDITCAANVANGVLDLEFLVGTAGNPSINAIMVKARANHAPSANVLAVTTLQDTPAKITLTASDPDGDYLLYTVSAAPLHGSLSGTAPNLTYTPNAGYSGADNISFYVSDGAAESAPATVSLTVTPVNQAPVITSAPTALPNPASTSELITFSTSASDVDGDTLTYSWNFGDGTTGTGATTTHTYTSVGNYAVVVTVSDGRGGTVAGSVDVTVFNAINSGGKAAGTFAADQNFSGGNTYTTTSAITTTGVTNPASQAVYQSERYGNFTYTIANLAAGASYTVRLHFAEIWWSSAGQRVFNVSINGTQVLSKFDIYAAAGGKFIAIVQEFAATAANGQIVISYTTVKDNAKSSGIEIISATAPSSRGASAPAADANINSDGAVSSIDLGTVRKGQSFKIKLEAPESGTKAKLRWGVVEVAKLAPGVAAKSGFIGGRPRTPGIYTFELQIKGKSTSVTNTYTLTVAP